MPLDAGCESPSWVHCSQVNIEEIPSQLANQPKCSGLDLAVDRDVLASRSMEARGPSQVRTGLSQQVGGGQNRVLHLTDCNPRARAPRRS